MNVVVSILDQDAWDARTDIIAVVKSKEKKIVWVPRDLWTSSIEERINQAFRRGKHELLLRCLTEHGLNTSASICIKRSVSERFLSNIDVYVPVSERMTFWYPLEPKKPIEEGRKAIEFNPPGELLAGEKIHQWIGARVRRRDTTNIHRWIRDKFRKKVVVGGDLSRIYRQQTLLQCLLKSKQDFSSILGDLNGVSASQQSAFDVITTVDETWEYDTFGPLVKATIGNKMVLLKK